MESGELSRGPTQPKRGALPRWLVGVIVALPALMLGVYLALRPERISAPEVKLTRFTSHSGIEQFPNLSPDGNQFVYVSGASGNLDIYLQRVGGENAVNLTEDSPADDTQPAFSPDGSRIAFRSKRDGGGLFVMGATGESVKRVVDFGFNPAWSPDGEFLMFCTDGVDGPSRRSEKQQLRVVRVETGEVRALDVNGDAVQPSWSPHGNRIAFWSISLTERNYRDIWTVPAEGGNAVAVTQDVHVDWNPVWSSDGNYLYFSSNRGGSYGLWRAPIDEETGITRGVPELVTASDVARIGQIATTRDGRNFVYQANLSVTNLHKIAFDPRAEMVIGDPVPIVPGSRSAFSPDVSPDGQRVAFAFSSGAGQADLAIVGADGTGLRQLTDEPQFANYMPRWSPDGTEIVFYSTRSGNSELWSIRPDGSALRQLTHTSSRTFGPLWSRDGTRIAYYSGGDSYLFQPALPWNEQIPEKLPRPQDGSFDFTFWSPDGSRLAGHWYDDSVRPSRIALFSLDSHEYEVLPVEGSWPLWLSDGRRIVFRHGEKLLLLEVETRRVQEVLLRDGLYVGDGYAISHDDRTIYFDIQRREAEIWMVTLEEGGNR